MKKSYLTFSFIIILTITLALTIGGKVSPAHLLPSALKAQNKNNSLISHKDQLWPSPELKKPAYLESYIDPAFGTKITRITGDVGTTIPGIGGTWQEIARHSYSKAQVWNADQSLLCLTTHRGKDRRKNTGGAIFLDAETYKPLFRRPLPYESRWHPEKPDIRIFVSSTHPGFISGSHGLSH